MPRKLTQDRDGIVIKRLQEGAWQARARVTGEGGVKRYKSRNGFPTEKEARAWAEATRTDFERGEENAARADLSAVWERYRAERMDGGKAKPQTVESMRKLVAGLLVAGAANMKAESFRPAVTRFFNAPKLSRSKSTTGRAAVSTRKRMYSQLRALINYAMVIGWLTKEPLPGFKPVGEREQDDTAREVLTLEEARKLVGLWKPEDPVWLYTMLMLYAGLRESEAQSVRWRDYRPEARVIDIPQGKGNKARRISVQPELVAILDAVSALSGPRSNPVPLKVQDREVVQRVTGRLPDFPKVVRMYRAAKITVDRGEDPITKMPRKVGRHSLRHTFCALMLASGESGDVVRQAMGHGSADLTALYGSQLTSFMHQVRVEAWERGQFKLVPKERLTADAETKEGVG